MQYPAVLNPAEVGNYPASCCSGGGFVWDAVLEYRVWCHPERGAPDEADGNDYFYAFETFEEADAFARATMGAEEPLALVLQREYIDEYEPGCYAPRYSQGTSSSRSPSRRSEASRAQRTGPVA
jgi:hypothetical protein